MPAPASAGRDRAARPRLAVDQQPPAVGLVDAGEDLHERRLAGAVLADERVRLAGVELDRAVLERLHRAEALLGPSAISAVGSARILSQGEDFVRAGATKPRRGERPSCPTKNSAISAASAHSRGLLPSRRATPAKSSHSISAITAHRVADEEPTVCATPSRGAPRASRARPRRGAPAYSSSLSGSPGVRSRCAESCVLGVAARETSLGGAGGRGAPEPCQSSNR